MTESGRYPVAPPLGLTQLPGFLAFSFELFFGNIGMELSYWGTFPLGILVSVLLAGVTSYRY